MRRSALVLLLGSGFAFVASGRATGASGLDRPSLPAVEILRPLAFEENHGQTDPAVRFVARMPGQRLFLTDDAAWMSGDAGAAPRLAIALEGADPAASVGGEGRLPGSTHYLIGSDSRLWQRAVPTYARVRYRSVYPGIDLVYYGNPDRLEFDFEVAPGADPGRIRMNVGGARTAALERNGDLCLSNENDERRLLRPVVYQEIDGRRRTVAAAYVLHPGEDSADLPSVGFEVGVHDRAAPLVIDPVLVSSTYLGGSDDDEVDALAVDVEGNTYVAGRTFSLNFPVSGGAAQPGFGGNEDTYVTKIDASGSAILYSTYIGGSDRDFGNAIAVDALGQAVVGGRTLSSNFPTASASPIQNTKHGDADGFVVQLNANGSDILWSTYLGGANDDGIDSLALDPGGRIIVSGRTESSGFPGTAGSPIGAAYGGNQDGFVAKLEAGGLSLLYATYLGGAGDDGALGVASDRQGSAYAVGFTESANFPGTGSSAIQKVNKGSTDAFLTKIDPAGSSIEYSTYLGGAGEDAAFAVAVDSKGDAIVVGSTGSTGFPGTAGSPIQSTFRGGTTDGFVTKIDSAGTAIVFSTYLGGTARDQTDCVALDSLGDAYVSGYTESPNFPGTAGSPIQASYGGQGDAFVVEIAPAGTLVYSTYLGGAGYDEGYGIGVNSRSAHVGGITESANFPGTSASPIQNVRRGPSDGFVSRISAADVPPRSLVPVEPPAPVLVGR
jgi:hypothetical protein